jgi:hypothetical protein
MRNDRPWWIAATVVALIGLGRGLIALLEPVAVRADVLLLPLCLLPVALLIGARTRARVPVAALLLLAGGVLTVVGVVQAVGDHHLDPYLATLSRWNVIWFGTGLSAFPAALALLFAGAGLLASRRWPLTTGLVLAAVTTGWFALAALAGPVSMADDHGFWLDTSALLATACYGVVGLFLLVMAAAGRPVYGPPTPPGVPAGRPARRGPLVATGVVITLLAAATLGWWLLLAPRVALAEVFADPALARCVAAETGTADASGTVSESDLGQVLSLTCGGGIESLSGVERLVNLASLDLRDNEIRDLSPLEGLEKLSQLTLTGNQIADLAPLATLPVLTDLGLSGNQVHDLGPLADVPSLRLLGLADNQISDLSPLAGLTGLAELDLSRNAITDVRPLSTLAQLNRLQVTDDRIADLAPLGRLAALTSLDVSGNQVADVSGLAGAQRLDELWLGRNPLTDITRLTALPALTGVDLEGVDPATPGVAELRARGVFVGGFA